MQVNDFNMKYNIFGLSIQIDYLEHSKPKRSNK